MQARAQDRALVAQALDPPDLVVEVRQVLS